VWATVKAALKATLVLVGFCLTTALIIAMIPVFAILGSILFIVLVMMTIGFIAFLYFRSYDNDEEEKPP
jgi:hypothetical protein